MLIKSQEKKLKYVAVTGGQGQLAQALDSLHAHAKEMGIKLLITNKSTLNICCQKNIDHFLDANPVDGLINTAAYTKVDLAETQAELAWATNVTGPSYLAHACKTRRIALLHLSSDYVFDGKKSSPYIESDPTLPLNVYGQTKLAGEQTIINVMPEAQIVRTSWLFSEYGHNFFKTIVNKAKNSADLSVVADQYGGPTYAPALAMVLLKMMQHHLNHQNLPGGIYHYAGQPCVSWFNFAKEILTQAQRLDRIPHLPHLVPIASDEFEQLATRPKYTCLNQSKLGKLIDLPDPDWHKGLALSLSNCP